MQIWKIVIAGYFYPRPPRGGRHWWPWRPGLWRYFYPRPPRGGRPKGIDHVFNGNGISIHALREEGDWLYIPYYNAAGEISIHALREEGDSLPSQRRCKQPYFYPRPPRGGRPAGVPRQAVPHLHFYPRPPRGGRPRMLSIYSLWGTFLSTPSARRATLLSGL